MKKTERENMLLFSKERVTGLHRYRLYFTPISSLKDEAPRVFRLLVRTPFAFNRFELGRIYTLQYYGIYILGFEPKEEFNLQEEDYTRLLHNRDVKFMDKRTSAALRSTDQPYFSKDRYYSFEETRAIINYRPDFLTTFAIATFSTMLTGIALLAPFALYTWMLYLLAQGQAALAGFTSKSLVLPLMGVGALPVTMFIMSVLFALSELALLRIDFTRWHILKKYTLAWGGMRKSIFVELSDTRYFSKFGIIAGSVLVVFVLISIFV